MKMVVNPADWSRLMLANQRMVNALRPTGGIAKFLIRLADMSRVAAIGYTHVDTGALQASHRVVFSPTGVTGWMRAAEAVVFVSPVRNPKHGLSTLEYGVIEESRGGSHAFYEQVLDNDFNTIFTASLMAFRQELFGV